MSDEQPPPSLRLRPRTPPPAAPSPEPVPPAPAIPPAPQEPAAAEAAEAGAADPFRLRLKPKTPPPEGLSVETPLPFSNPPIQQPEVTPAAAVPPLAPSIAVTSPLPVVPPTAPPLSAAVVPPSLAQTKPPLPMRPPGQGTPPPTIKADKWLAAVVIVLLVLGVGFYGVRYLMKAHPKPKPVGHLPSTSREEKPAAESASAPANSQPRLVDNPQSSAGKAVARARDTVAAVERREQEEGVANVLGEGAQKPVAKPSTVPSDTRSSVVPAESNPAPTETPAVQTEPVVPPSEAFRQFVINLRVNSVSQGERPLAMINNRVYRIGDLVDIKLNITLYRIEAEEKNLVFRDDTGAVVKRHY